MKRYLLVEGITDIAFVKYVCFKHEITTKFNDFKKDEKEYIFKNLVLINIDGQTNLDSELSFLKPQSPKIKKIAIIQDSDNDFLQSTENIKDSIEKSEIESSKVTYFLTPNNQDLGDLETLLLSTIQKEDKIIQCFVDYKKCLTNSQEIYPKALNKAQVYAYTMFSQSGKDLHKPHNSFMYKYNKKYKDTELWDLTKDEFQPIIKFIVDFYTN